MGFAAVGFGLIYLAVRYNSFYVLTNNVDTKGAAYAKALQQLMVGVYLGEVCLAGLFGIAEAWVQLALMVFFIFCTALYHAFMRHAFKPMEMYLPKTFESDQVSLFTTTDHKSYDYQKSGVSPTEFEAYQTSKWGAMKANWFAKIWDPRKFKSHSRVQAMVPDYPPPQYTAEEEALAYYDPALTSPVPRLWIVRDTMGISQREVKDSSEVVEISDSFATFNEKGKVVWEYENQGRLEDVPIWEKRVDY